jgi:hypothetical protein
LKRFSCLAMTHLPPVHMPDPATRDPRLCSGRGRKLGRRQAGRPAHSTPLCFALAAMCSGPPSLPEATKLLPESVRRRSPLTSSAKPLSRSTPCSPRPRRFAGQGTPAPTDRTGRDTRFGNDERWTRHRPVGEFDSDDPVGAQIELVDTSLPLSGLPGWPAAETDQSQANEADGVFANHAVIVGAPPEDRVEQRGVAPSSGTSVGRRVGVRSRPGVGLAVCRAESLD